MKIITLIKYLLSILFSPNTRARISLFSVILARAVELGPIPPSSLARILWYKLGRRFIGIHWVPAFAGTTGRKGFTLVEAMVAIAILSLSITAPLLIAQKGIGSAIYARDQITAFYLAQEGVEYIRNMRDTNKINTRSWLIGLDLCQDVGGQKCMIDARYTDPFVGGSQAIKACNEGGVVGACPLLRMDQTTGIYGYDGGWTPTKFKRTIHVQDLGREALIAVTIEWDTNLFTPTRAFTVREYMFDY